MSHVDYFLKIDGIPGEAQDARHKGEIQLESWSMASTTGTDRSPGMAAKVHDVNCSCRMSIASAKLMLACASGQHIAKAVLTARKAGKGQEDFFKVTFSDVLVASYRISGGKISRKGGADGENIIPQEDFSLNFARVDYEYRMQKQDGSLSGTVKSSYSVKDEKGQGQ